MKNYFAGIAIKGLVLKIVITSALIPCHTAQGQPLNSKFIGTWHSAAAMERCEQNYHTITVQPNVLTITYVKKGAATEADQRKAFEYKILSADEQFYRLLLKDETRLDEHGKPVVWHLKPLGNNQYCWGRDDWPAEGCTPARHRCKVKS